MAGMHNMRQVTDDKLLSASERTLLREFVQRLGESAVCHALGIGRLSLARLLGGLPALRSTVRAARAGISALRGGDPS